MWQTYYLTFIFQFGLCMFTWVLNEYLCGWSICTVSGIKGTSNVLEIILIDSNAWMSFLAPSPRGDAKLTRMCTLWRCKSMLTWKTKLLCNDKDYSSGVRQQSENTQASGPCAPDPWPFELEVIGFDRLSRTTTVPSFKLFWSRGFHFSMLIYTPTHMHTSWQSDHNIHTATMSLMSTSPNQCSYFTLWQQMHTILQHHTSKWIKYKKARGCISSQLFYSLIATTKAIMFKKETCSIMAACQESMMPLTSGCCNDVWSS